MLSFRASMAAYEDGLRKLFGDYFRERDLDAKHAKMREDPFVFLRGTCWRWAEAAPELCPALMRAPAAGSVGDAHVGNFGLWRDAEARLVFGVNDFDEAARTPWPLDLVRLAASAIVADDGLDAAEIAGSILKGYAEGLGRPRAFVLEREHLDLRDAYAATDEKREDFWRDLEEGRPEPPAAPPGFEAQLKAALPGVSAPAIFPRQAGVGSLGRPRFVAYGEVGGGPAAREIKGRAPSCWGHDDPGLAQRLAAGNWRSPDPYLQYGADAVLRRLAPNNRKLKLDELKARRADECLSAMAADIAAIHAGETADFEAIRLDLTSRGDDWLAQAARKVAAWTLDEHHAWAE
jgi:hypothetical protein